MADIMEMLCSDPVETAAPSETIEPHANVPEPQESKSPESHDMAGQTVEVVEKVQTVEVVEVKTPMPSLGTVREDGKMFDARSGLWLKQTNWDNLERARGSKVSGKAA
jgi:hypothetical protein